MDNFVHGHSAPPPEPAYDFSGRDSELPGHGHILPLGKGSEQRANAILRDIQRQRTEKLRQEEEARRRAEFSKQEEARKTEDAAQRVLRDKDRTLRRRKQAKAVFGDHWGGQDPEAGGEIRVWTKAKDNWFWFVREVWSRARFPLYLFLGLLLFLWTASISLDLYHRAYGIDEYGAAPDPSRTFTDRLGRSVVDPVHPHMLRPEESDVDSAIARWILSEAEFWRLSKAQIASGYVEVWLYGARRARNVSLVQVHDALAGSRHECVCASHLGIPIHALKVGKTFMVEPKLGAQSRGTRSWTFEDRLLPGIQVTLDSPLTLWVDYSDLSGTGHVKLFQEGAVACIQHCAGILLRARKIT